jgi:hypothetical protein
LIRFALLLAAALAFACESPGDSSDRDRDAERPDLVTLEGPFPETVEGTFEITKIENQNERGDYLALGWIETDDGVVSVAALGSLLESARAGHGDVVLAQLKPSEARPTAYDIVELSTVE